MILAHEVNKKQPMEDNYEDTGKKFQKEKNKDFVSYHFLDIQ